jgi:hypothetical protein
MRKLIVLLAVVSLGATAQKCDKKDCTEKIQEDCMCTMQYDPVCGCNNKTYGNACTARCHGITKYVKGECPGNEAAPAEPTHN